MKTVNDLITALQQYDPNDGVIIFGDIKIYRTITHDINYVGVIHSNIGYHDVEEFYE